MARMETDCDMDFCKSIRVSVFQRFKFGLKIVEILQKSCCNMDFLQEMAFNHLELIKFSLHKFMDHFLNTPLYSCVL